MAKTTTTKRIKSTTNNSDGIDRISELPDEIIHKVLHHVSSASPVEAARTAVLSRRLRSVWDYYPSMQYRFKDLPHSTVEKRLENFRKFVEASMKRFSRHRQIRMETLDILLAEKFADYYWSLVKQVLEFAMERRVEEIYISSRVPGEDIHANFRYNRYKSLQLIGMGVETVDIGHVSDFKKLQISDLPHLKMLRTLTCEEMEIEAPRLQNLHLSCHVPVQKLSFRAPQLKHLEIMLYVLEVNFLNAVISELPSLKTLTLGGYEIVMKKLELSIPKLEVFKLLGLPNMLEKIEFGACPTMWRFILHTYSLGDLRKCEIDNANASEGRYRSHLCFVKYFIRAAPHCQTVSITNLDEEHNVTFMLNGGGEKLRNPGSINHLKYCTVQSNSKVDKRALLEALFRVCHPKHLTIIHRHKNSKRFFQGLLSIMRQSLSNKGGADESLMRLNGLKDVKIITQDVDVEIEEEEEIMRYTKCKTKNQLCLELTWG